MVVNAPCLSFGTCIRWPSAGTCRVSNGKEALQHRASPRARESLEDRNTSVLGVTDGVGSGGTGSPVLLSATSCASGLAFRESCTLHLRTHSIAPFRSGRFSAGVHSHATPFPCRLFTICTRSRHAMSLWGWCLKEHVCSTCVKLLILRYC